MQANVSNISTSCGVSTLTARRLLAKKQRITNGMEMLLDIAKESANWFPPLKTFFVGVNILIKHHEVLHSCSSTGPNRRLPQQRLMKTPRRHVDWERRHTADRVRSLTTHTVRVCQRSRSALEETWKLSRESPAKSTTAWLMDNAGNSAEVAGRVERLQEVITHHQVSEHCLVVPSMTYTEGRTSQQ